MRFSASEVVDELRRFYDDNAIACGSFRCKHADECRTDMSRRPLVHGAEAHVGSRYGDMLRVVVVSLDTGGDATNMERRRETIETIGDRPNRHMRGTIELLTALMPPSMRDESPLPYFAMTNACKCSANDGRRDMVGPELYERCRPFALKELVMLRPQIVVTQGDLAHAVVKPYQNEIDNADLKSVLNECGVADPPASVWIKAMVREYLCSVSLESSNAVCMVTPHHASRGGQWPHFRRLMMEPIATIGRLLAERVATCP